MKKNDSRRYGEAQHISQDTLKAKYGILVTDTAVSTNTVHQLYRNDFSSRRADSPSSLSLTQQRLGFLK